MTILVVDNGTSYLQQLVELLSPHTTTIIPWKDFSEHASTRPDAIVLSGGHSLPVMNHDREYSHELNLIRETDIPLIGICLGYELIAHAFGSTLRRLEAQEKGLVQLRVVQPHQILLGVSEAQVYESHRWVVKQVAPPLVGLVSSKDGYEIIMHESKPLFGFQFHPEMYQEKTVGDEILNNCLRYIQER